MEYYNSIFGVLSACAMRQLDDYNFVVSKVPLAALWQHLQQIVKRRSSKENIDIELCCEPTEAVACGDFDQWRDAAGFAVRQCGVYWRRVCWAWRNFAVNVGGRCRGNTHSTAWKRHKKDKEIPNLVNLYKLHMKVN